MNWLAGKIGTIYQEPAHAIGLSTPPIGCVLDLPGVPGGGNKIYDRSPYGNHGTITGAVWKRLPSGLWYLDFDGDDFILIKDSELVGFETNLTIEAWAQYEGTTTTQFIYCEGTSAGTLLYLRLSEGKPQFGLLRKTPTTWHTAIASNAISQNTWHRLACSLSSTAGMKVYDNGAEVGSDANTDPMNYGTPTKTEIGRMYKSPTPSDYFLSPIGLPRVHNRALSALEIQNHYQQEKYLFGVW